jgi:hypothetical protein
MLSNHLLKNRKNSVHLYKALHLFIRGLYIILFINMAVKTRKKNTKHSSKNQAKQVSNRANTNTRIIRSVCVKPKQIALTKTKLIKKLPKVINKTAKTQSKNKPVLPKKKKINEKGTKSNIQKKVRRSIPRISNVKLLLKPRVRKPKENSFVSTMLSSSLLKCQKKKQLSKPK